MVAQQVTNMNKTIENQKKLIDEVCEIYKVDEKWKEILLNIIDICFLEGQAEELRHQLKKFER